MHSRFLGLFLLAISVASPAWPQAAESYHALLSKRVASPTLAPPASLTDFVHDGKLRLGLRDAIMLALLHNTGIQIEEMQVETQKFGVLSAHSAFDPSIASTWNVNRSSSPTYSQLQGAGTSGSIALNALAQSGMVSYTQTFHTGTVFEASLSASKSSTNSSYNFYNPYYNSSLNFQFTQPLLQNAGRFANTAPLLIARRTLDQSRANFESQVNDAVLQTVDAYWTVVQARGSLDVQMQSLQLAEASYKHDKRALDLGALSPLDINRSESEMAARKVQRIQAETALTQAEETLRIILGANQDPQTRNLHFDLTESPEPDKDGEPLDLDAAMKDALNQRPETRAATDAVANDQTSVRLARNQLLPSLSFTGFYQSNGLGGQQYDLTTGHKTGSGGLGSSFSQMFDFGYPAYGGQVSLTLPVRNSAARARLGNALVARRRDLLGQQQTQEQIVRDVRNAVLQLDEAQQALAAAKDSLDLSRKSLAADERKYELGAETNFFVLDSQTRLAQAQLALLQAQVTYRVALATVEHATGKLLDPYKIKIDESMR
ncbi:MAG: TolC family protein [Terracidiphilus sp.]|nr:TolC family protein [Terracidiphilus sp.]